MLEVQVWLWALVTMGEEKSHLGAPGAHEACNWCVGPDDCRIWACGWTVLEASFSPSLSGPSHVVAKDMPPTLLRLSSESLGIKATSKRLGRMTMYARGAPSQPAPALAAQERYTTIQLAMHDASVIWILQLPKCLLGSQVTLLLLAAGTLD